MCSLYYVLRLHCATCRACVCEFRHMNNCRCVDRSTTRPPMANECGFFLYFWPTSGILENKKKLLPLNYTPLMYSIHRDVYSGATHNNVNIGGLFCAVAITIWHLRTFEWQQKFIGHARVNEMVNVFQQKYICISRAWSTGEWLLQNKCHNAANVFEKRTRNTQWQWYGWSCRPDELTHNTLKYRLTALA